MVEWGIRMKGRERSTSSSQTGKDNGNIWMDKIKWRDGMWTYVILIFTYKKKN